MERRSLTLSPANIAADQLGFFRWGRVAGRVLVTNDAGDWAFLTSSEFDDLLAGQVVDGHPRFAEFQRKGFVRDGLDLDALAARVAQRHRHVRRGLHLHVVTLTRRRAPVGAGRSDAAPPADDMTPETAERIADLALQSASPTISFEFQGHGGEPLLNHPVLSHFVEYIESRNRDAAGKTLSFTVVSNLTAMTEQIAEWLIENNVLLRTTLDGPADVHDWNRRWKAGSAHAEVVRWIDYFTRRYGELGRDPEGSRVETLLTTTRRTLEAWREVVDEYVARGIRRIHLRPLNLAFLDRQDAKPLGYTEAEYLDFYRRTLDYIVELNRRGVDITEHTASIVLRKILTTDDPGVVDWQSPSGEGTGQVAYDVDGGLFPCDEARIVSAMGDPIFALGHVGHLTLAELVRHPTVRAIAAASLLDAQPMCASCWNKPFCGFSPVRNFVTQGDLFGQRLRCFECKEHMVVSTRLFEMLANDRDCETADILARWTVKRAGSTNDCRALTQAP